MTPRIAFLAAATAAAASGRRAWLLGLAPLILAGCVAGPAYQRPPITAPDAHRGAAAAADAAPGASAASTAAADAESLADRPWWELVGDPALGALITESLAANHDLRLATLRIQEARAQSGIARAERWPALQASVAPSYARQSAFLSPVTDPSAFYTVDLGVSWELDLWGRVRRLERGALARYLESEEAARAVRLALVADVATGYFRLRALDEQLEIARRTAEAYRATHALFDARFRAGLASGLETVSAQAFLAATSATIPDLERRIAAQENALAYLAGRNPGTIARGLPLGDQPLPPRVAPGLPSDLLARRPDLRAAEQEMIAANADVGVAIANYFPRLSLTGALGGVSTELAELFSSGRTWSVGGSILSPLVQGGRLRSEHRVAVARSEQARVRYEQAVTSAFREVATALAAHRDLAAAEEERARAVVRFREALEIATSRYRSGLSAYLDVLLAQQLLLPAENLLAETRFTRLEALVELYRALGGGYRLGDDAWRTRAALVDREPGFSDAPAE